VLLVIVEKVEKLVLQLGNFLIDLWRVFTFTLILQHLLLVSLVPEMLQVREAKDSETRLYFYVCLLLRGIVERFIILKVFRGLTPSNKYLFEDELGVLPYLLGLNRIVLSKFLGNRLRYLNIVMSLRQNTAPQS
jgi:hypothetical protein